jgi:hypothetical protein
MKRIKGFPFLLEAVMGTLLLRMVQFVDLLHPWIAWLGNLCLLHKFYISFLQQKLERGINTFHE